MFSLKLGWSINDFNPSSSALIKQASAKYIQVKIGKWSAMCSFFRSDSEVYVLSLDTSFIFKAVFTNTEALLSCQ